MNPLLSTIPILGALNERALKLLSEEAQPLTFPAGMLIVKEGDSGNKMFIIDSGQVRVSKHCERAGEVELAILGPGDCFGEGCILTTLPRVASVRAVTDTALFQLSAMAFYRLHHALPDQHSILILNLARELARRLRRLDEIYAACH